MQMKQMKMYLMEPMQDQDWDEVLAEGGSKTVTRINRAEHGVGKPLWSWS